MKTLCNPKRHRKYQDKLDTHLTSKSLVMTPDCNMDLKRIVSGNGSLRMTKPAKKALIQDMISVCGIIMAMFPFIIPIMPSMAAGSDIGLGAA